MIQVSKSQFYAVIGPKDICVTSRNLDHSRFETRDRIEVGRSYWLEDGERKYFLTEHFYKQNQKTIEGEPCKL